MLSESFDWACMRKKALQLDSPPGDCRRLKMARKMSAESTNTQIHSTVSSIIRVLIADDHSVMRQGLSGALNQEPDMVIVGEAINGKKAVECARALHPDVILMDLGMPEMGGVEATQKIHSEMPKIRVIGLSMFDEMEIATTMIKAGAVAYLNKSCSIEELTSAIRRSMG
jgi:DNA-binding NarL/FixJ family response regulator